MTTTVSGVNAQTFKDWMDEHGWSVRRLATALEREPRTIQRYRDGSLDVPKVVELALIGLEHTKDARPRRGQERPKGVRDPVSEPHEDAP